MKTIAMLMAVCVTIAMLSATQAMAQEKPMTPINMFGGESYQGEPALAVTAALVKAGGGADDFSFATALVSMLGE